LFDVGHGQGSFDWDVVDAAGRAEFFPDLISTDLHSGNVDGAVRDLTNVASKFLLAGMPFNDASYFLKTFFQKKNFETINT
jgi:dihydroorotase